MRGSIGHAESLSEIEAFFDEVRRVMAPDHHERAYVDAPSDV